jgi:hypothetical protein
MEKEIKYKGNTIKQIKPSGVFEYYSDKQKRFLKFDDLGRAKASIDKEKSVNEAPKKKIKLTEIRAIVKQLMKESNDSYDLKKFIEYFKETFINIGKTFEKRSNERYYNNKRVDFVTEFNIDGQPPGFKLTCDFVINELNYFPYDLTEDEYIYWESKNARIEAIVDVYYRWDGSYSPASRYQPEEGPELECYVENFISLKFITDSEEILIKDENIQNILKDEIELLIEYIGNNEKDYFEYDDTY